MKMKKLQYTWTWKTTLSKKSRKNYHQGAEYLPSTIDFFLLFNIFVPRKGNREPSLILSLLVHSVHTVRVPKTLFRLIVRVQYYFRCIGVLSPWNLNYDTNRVTIKIRIKIKKKFNEPSAWLFKIHTNWKLFSFPCSQNLELSAWKIKLKQKKKGLARTESWY